VCHQTYEFLRMAARVATVLSWDVSLLNQRDNFMKLRSPTYVLIRTTDITSGMSPKRMITQSPNAIVISLQAPCSFEDGTTHWYTIESWICPNHPCGRAGHRADLDHAQGSVLDHVVVNTASAPPVTVMVAPTLLVMSPLTLLIPAVSATDLLLISPPVKRITADCPAIKPVDGVFTSGPTNPIAPVPTGKQR